MIIKISQIILIVILCVFDVFAFAKAVHPCVSQPYRDYFIRHTIKVDEYIAAARGGKAEPNGCLAVQ